MPLPETAPEEEVRSQVRRAGRAASRMTVAAVLALSAAIGIWALRNAWISSPVSSDAARHAMNGALLLDLAREGQFANPRAFAEAYYAHLPAVSIPYHPPLFPAFEAVIYGLFGVSYASARIAVALCTALAAVLFCLMVLRTHRSPALAAGAAVVYFGLNSSQSAAQEAMLEFPSLVPLLAALLAFLRVEREGRLRDWLWFAAAGAAAIWTKQHAVLLAAVPFLYIILARRWALLRSPGLWIATASLGAAIVSLQALSRLAQSANTGWRDWPLHVRIPHHISYYFDSLYFELGAGGTAAAAAGVVYYLIQLARGRAQREHIYAAWAAAAAALLLVLPPWEDRYLFYVYPPVAVLALAAFAAGAARLRIPRTASAPLGAALIAAFVYIQTNPPNLLTGMDEAAQAALSTHPRRILLHAPRNGTFIFAARAADPARSAMIIRADKIAPEYLDPDAFRKFLHDYAIDTVVIEDLGTDGQEPRPPVEGLRPVHSVVQRGTNVPAGVVTVYRYEQVPLQPSRTMLKLRSELVPEGMQVRVR